MSISVEQKFKVGDKVTTHKQEQRWRYGGSMPDGAEGTVCKMTDSDGVDVQLEDGDNWLYHVSELWHVERTETSTECPAIGTRVQTPDVCRIGLNGFFPSSAGKPGVVTKHLDNPSWVAINFDDGSMDAGFWECLRILDAPITTHPRTITLDGVTYTLTPVAEAPVEEERREPQRGEVWRVGNGQMILLTSQRNVHLKSGNEGSWDHRRIGKEGSFVASSLAEALESGKLTTADLR